MSRFRKTGFILLSLAMAAFCDRAFAQVSSFTVGHSRTIREGPPKGWTFGGNVIHGYRTWTDVAQGLPIGSRCSIIDREWRAAPGTNTGPSSRFATVMQAVSAEEYRGKRVRFSAQISTVDVAGQAGLWMRVDGQNGKVLGFDQMATRPIQGTTLWNRYDIVLDVPQESTAIQFGYLLAGSGKVKAAQFRFEVVDANTPPTATGVPATDEALSRTPSNLDLHL